MVNKIQVLFENVDNDKSNRKNKIKFGRGEDAYE